jgi:3-methylcrotonyl-CoA carboxylase alpha subunit
MALKLTLAGEVHEIEIVRRRPHLVVKVDGRLHEIASMGEPGTGARRFVVDGETIDVVRAASGDTGFVRLAGRTFEVGYIDPRDAADAGDSSRDEIHAPMPGAVVSVHKAAGDTVVRGEVIITIESMKLQTALPAPRDGVIGAVLKREGETFEKDEVVVRLEAIGDGA